MVFTAEMSGIFISYRREDSAAVAGRLFDRLSQRFGKDNIFRDIDTVDPGAEFTKVIKERIRVCDVLLALIGKNWIDARDAAGQRRLDQPHDLVAAEISEALAQRKLVIPTLVERASMPTHEALPRRMTPLADRNAVEISDARFDYDVGRLIAAIEKVVAPQPEAGESSRFSEKGLRTRRELLADVQGEVADRLAQSLPSAALINVRKETQPQQVRRPWDVEVKVGHQPSTLLPPGTEIVDVFVREEVKGKLLILGAPGAGKTTALLQLAKHLAHHAEQDVSVPVPILLNLSSWKDDNQPIDRWLAAELKVKYGVRNDIGERWLNEGGLTPLLDGLDELEPMRQGKCVQAMSQFQQDYRPKHLVVSCRLAEYQNSSVKLQLNGAVCLQPLTDEQVRNYLVDAKAPELWTSIQNDTVLFGLAKSPLLLSMMRLVHQERSIQEWRELSLTRERHQYLFDMYIERMLSREKKSDEYTKEKTLHWLGWLARRLQDQGQAEFLIETIQPTWLQSRTQTWLYRFAVVLCVLLIFGMYAWGKEPLMASVASGTLAPTAAEHIDRSVGALGAHRSQNELVIDMIVGLIVALIVGLKRTIKPIETLRWSGTKAWSAMIRGLQRWSIAALRYGAYIGFLAGQFGFSIWYLSVSAGVSNELAVWERVGQISGVLAGLLVGVVILLAARSSVWVNRGFRGRPNISWSDALICGLIVGLAMGWSHGRTEGLGSGLMFAMLSALATGMITGLSRELSDRPAFRVVDALIVALIGWLIGGLITWVIGAKVLPVLPVWLDLWLSAWLGVALASALFAGLIAKLRGKARPIVCIQGPEIGLWAWVAVKWRKWLIAGIIAALAWSLTIWGLGYMEGALRGIALASSRFGLGMFVLLDGSLLAALLGAAMGALWGAIFGSLFGALGGGLTGPDIDRRTVPNQGIRASASNVGVFAVIGGLTVGTIWGLLNLSTAMLMTGLTPEPADWLYFGLGNVLLVALLSALLPGSACIQHFALRFILWCRGVAPWNYARFLDYVTERMLLQRVGGRYRFIHGLLRDHCATMEARRVES